MSTDQCLEIAAVPSPDRPPPPTFRFMATTARMGLDICREFLGRTNANWHDGHPPGSLFVRYADATPYRGKFVIKVQTNRVPHETRLLEKQMVCPIYKRVDFGMFADLPKVSDEPIEEFEPAERL